MLKKTKSLMCMVMIFVLMLSSISVHANEQVSEENLKLTNGKIYNEKHGTLKYEGQMLNGVPHGYGKSYGWSSRDGAVLNYEGNWINGKREGFGKSYISGKISYIGTWKNDQKYGFGADFHSNGTLYHIGEFKDNYPNGVGIRYVYGEFKNECISLGRNGRYNLSITRDINKVTVDIPTKKGMAIVHGKEVEIDVLDEDKFMNILDDYNTVNSLGWNSEVVVEKLTYEGDRDKNNNRTGYGQLINLDGDLLYTGGFKDNKMDGYGLLHKSGYGFSNENDSSYIGELSQNRILGLGATISEDNEIGQISYTYIDENLKTQTNKFKLSYLQKKMEHYPIIIDDEKHEKALRRGDGYNPDRDPRQPDNTFDGVKFKQMVCEYEKKWKKIFEEDTKEYYKIQKSIEEKNKNKPKQA